MAAFYSTLGPLVMICMTKRQRLKKNVSVSHLRKVGVEKGKRIYAFIVPVGALCILCERVLLNAHAGSHMSVLTVNPSFLHAGKGQHGMAT